MKPDLKNKSAVILGAARSGLAAAALLRKHDVAVFVSERSAGRDKAEELDLLKGLGIPFEFGGHTDSVYAADFIVLSPGIPQTSPVVARAISKGIPVYSEIETAYWFCRSPLIAVTGSNGKTTTTTLVGEMLRSQNPDAIVAGNIGQPFSGQVLKSRPDTWGVIEVSSFQLETIEKFHPRTAMILNLSPNHLDWYDSFEDYVRAKLRILKNLTFDDVLIFDADDSFLTQRIEACPARKMGFSVTRTDTAASIQGNALFLGRRKIIQLDELKLFGKHNYKNAMAACLAAAVSGLPDSSMSSVLSSFSGVEHRLEPVAEIDGIRFINDSKATTLESLEAALNSFEKPVILIAGGKDKGADFERLRELVKERVKKAVLIGSTRNKIREAWDQAVPVYLADDLDDAVHHAAETASAGDRVLLSPACSSFDMFRDYEDRGKKFKETVHNLKREHANN